MGGSAVSDGGWGDSTGKFYSLFFCSPLPLPLPLLNTASSLLLSFSLQALKS